MPPFVLSGNGVWSDRDGELDRIARPHYPLHRNLKRSAQNCICETHRLVAHCQSIDALCRGVASHNNRCPQGKGGGPRRCLQKGVSAKVKWDQSSDDECVYKEENQEWDDAEIIHFDRKGWLARNLFAVYPLCYAICLVSLREHQDMMSAPEGGGGSWKSGCRKGGCVNFVI